MSSCNHKRECELEIECSSFDNQSFKFTLRIDNSLRRFWKRKLLRTDRVSGVEPVAKSDSTRKRANHKRCQQLSLCSSFVKSLSCFWETKALIFKIFLQIFRVQSNVYFKNLTSFYLLCVS